MLLDRVIELTNHPLVTAISLAVAVLSVGLTIWTWRSSRRESRQGFEHLERRYDSALGRTVSWADYVASTDLLSKQVVLFDPDLILCLDSKGGLAAEMVSDRIGRRVPILVGYRSHEESVMKSSSPDILRLFDGRRISRYHVHFPPELDALKDRKILVVDDYSFTGDSLYQSKRYLVDLGFEESNIRTAALFVSSDTPKSRVPDMSVGRFPGSKVVLPYMGLR